MLRQREKVQIIDFAFLPSGFIIKKKCSEKFGGDFSGNGMFGRDMDGFNHHERFRDTKQANLSPTEIELTGEMKKSKQRKKEKETN